MKNMIHQLAISRCGEVSKKKIRFIAADMFDESPLESALEIMQLVGSWNVGHCHHHHHHHHVPTHVYYYDWGPLNYMLASVS